MSVDSELAEAARKVAETFDAIGVPYAIGGSVASSLYGEPRATRDIDLVAILRPEQAKPLAQALEGGYYADEESILEAIRLRRSFNVIHLDTMVKLDVFVCKDTAFSRSQIERRRQGSLGGEPPLMVSFASPEDTVLAKLEWYRLGGETSDRQWNDILGVLKVQGRALDDAYLDRWAPELGLDDLLARAREDAG